MRTTMVTAAAGVVALGAIAGGLAQALSPQLLPLPTHSVTLDADLLEQGDQSSPSSGDAAPGAVDQAAGAWLGGMLPRGDRSTSSTAPLIVPAALTKPVPTEGPEGTESTEGVETESLSDGPGGHVDPLGDVQHQGATTDS